MSLYSVQKALFRLNNDPAERQRFAANPERLRAISCPIP